MPYAFAQHKMMPPAANIGTKKLTYEDNDAFTDLIKFYLVYIMAYLLAL